jgi:hypothetical protein
VWETPERWARVKVQEFVPALLEEEVTALLGLPFFVRCTKEVGELLPRKRTGSIWAGRTW